MVREVEQVAKEEHRTVSELLRETFRQYKARRNFQELATEARKLGACRSTAQKFAWCDKMRHANTDDIPQI